MEDKAHDIFIKKKTEVFLNHVQDTVKIKKHFKNM